MRGAPRSKAVNSLLFTLWIYAVLMAAVFFVCRYAMFRAFVDPESLGQYGDAVRALFVTGLRYDSQIAAAFLFPILLVGLFLTSRNGWRRGAPAILAVLFASATTAAILFSFINYFYYQTYQNHFDIFFFSFFTDNVGAVMENVTEDYPFFRVLGATLLAFVGAALLGRRLLRSAPPIAGGCAWTLALSFVALAAMFWNSTNFSILREKNRNVSSHSVINKLVPNGVIAFQWALKAHKRATRFSPVSPEQGAELLGQLGWSSLAATVPENAALAGNRPHVVLAIVESLGLNIMAYDNPPKNDLLGSLRRHMEEDFLFTRFLPEGNNTMPSFSALNFLSPSASITFSSVKKRRLPNTPYDVYARAGYRTAFIYTGNLAWRDMGEYMETQGVDEIYGESALLERYPAAKNRRDPWGLEDEFAYALAEDLLRNADSPMFICILTTFNHPPYGVPHGYAPGPLDMPDAYRSAFGGADHEVRTMPVTFQYSCNQAGSFLDRLKARSDGRPVVFALTADHQTRRVAGKIPSGAVASLGVPFLLHLPAAIRAAAEWRYDPARVGSHKDIFPTLYSYSLPGVDYLALGGRNILAPDDDEEKRFGYNTDMVIDENGAHLDGTGDFHYPWADGESLELRNDAVEDAGGLAKKMRLYRSLLWWQINARVDPRFAGFERPDLGITPKK